MIPNRILVPYDFSDFSQSALAYAAGLASAFEASVTLLHAVDFPIVTHGSIPSSMEVAAEARAMAVLRGKLEEECAQLDPSLKDRVNVRVRPGSPPREIAEEVREGDYDLIVIGTHGRGAFRKAILGSVAEKTIRIAACPVLTVHKDQQFEVPKHFLFTTDLSTESWASLSMAAAWAKRFGARMTVLHVMEDPADMQVFSMTDFPFFEPDATVTDAEDRARTQLEEQYGMVATSTLADVESQSSTQSGKPADEIVKAAASGVDLIVMSTHGRRGMQHALIGSVAEAVTRRAPCPVLAVKPEPPTAS